MAKKKTNEKASFDLDKVLEDMDIPNSLKAGFKYYVINNNITIKSENDFEKEFTKFKQTNAGV
jgi:type I restriction-modification system DNA methylase subunit